MSQHSAEPIGLSSFAVSGLDLTVCPAMVPDSLIIYDIATRDGVKSNEVIRLWSKDIPTQPDDALNTGGSRTETCVFDRMFGECRLAQFDDARRYALRAYGLRARLCACGAYGSLAVSYLPIALCWPHGAIWQIRYRPICRKI